MLSEERHDPQRVYYPLPRKSSWSGLHDIAVYSNATMGKEKHSIATRF